MVTGAVKQIKILAVEDNPAILDFYREFFSDMGFEVKTAEDALSAITLYQQFKPDIIVLDLNIPAGGGMMVFDGIRSGHKDPVPIIFSTGKPEMLPHNIKILHKVAVITKPTPPEALLAEIRRLLPHFFDKPLNPVPPPPPSASVRARAARRRVLVVDDDPNIIALYTEILVKAGFEVKTAEDTIGAVTMFQEFRPELVILDVEMPAGGGRKVFERLRIQLASPAPILFSTATPGSVADLEKNLNVMVIKKPVSPGVLVGAVKDLLKMPQL
jgi:DNA-binding response OmpR family regulator